MWLARFTKRTRKVVAKVSPPSESSKFRELGGASPDIGLATLQMLKSQSPPGTPRLFQSR